MSPSLPSYRSRKLSSHHISSYVNNYKNLLESLYNVEIKESGIITSEDLLDEDIGCVQLYSGADIYYDCLNAPKFIYSTSYWIQYSGEYSYGVLNFGEVHFVPFENDYLLGVRPVIVISKDYF